MMAIKMERAPNRALQTLTRGGSGKPASSTTCSLTTLAHAVFAPLWFVASECALALCHRQPLFSTPTPTHSQIEQEAPPSWACPRCTLVNLAAKSRCGACGGARPRQAASLILKLRMDKGSNATARPACAKCSMTAPCTCPSEPSSPTKRTRRPSANAVVAAEEEPAAASSAASDALVATAASNCPPLLLAGPGSDASEDDDAAASALTPLLSCAPCHAAFKTQAQLKAHLKDWSHKCAVEKMVYNAESDEDEERMRNFLDMEARLESTDNTSAMEKFATAVAVGPQAPSAWTEYVNKTKSSKKSSKRREAFVLPLASPGQGTPASPAATAFALPPSPAASSWRHPNTASTDNLPPPGTFVMARPRRKDVLFFPGEVSARGLRGNKLHIDFFDGDRAAVVLDDVVVDPVLCVNQMVYASSQQSGSNNPGYDLHLGTVLAYSSDQQSYTVRFDAGSWRARWECNIVCLLPSYGCVRSGSRPMASSQSAPALQWPCKPL